jgi:hypothetical protein
VDIKLCLDVIGLDREWSRYGDVSVTKPALLTENYRGQNTRYRLVQLVKYDNVTALPQPLVTWDGTTSWTDSRQEYIEEHQIHQMASLLLALPIETNNKKVKM